MAVTYTPVSNRLGRRMRHPTLDVDSTLRVGGIASFSSLVRMANPVYGQGAPISINTAGNTTLTIAQLLAGIITIDPNGAGRTITFPTAALMVAGMTGCAVGDTIEVFISNGADAAETLTFAAGTGGAFDAAFLAAKTIAQSGQKVFYLRLTNVTSGAEAYVVYM